jgi:carbamate kinase
VTGQKFLIVRVESGGVTNTEQSRQGGGAPTVVALGGNALDSGEESVEPVRAVIEQTADTLVEAIEAGHDLVLTHGNGPQVGDLLLQQEQSNDTPERPLDVLVAQTQAQLGYPLQSALDERLPGARHATTVVTQTVVDADDPAFEEPTKPVGPFYTEREAAAQPFETRCVGNGERAFRRVVPSPKPREVVERDEIAGLLAEGTVPICAGGGGIPVVRDDGLRGVEAVVDKDRTSRLLASSLGAETMVVLTDVDCAYLDFGGPDQRPLGTVSPGEMREYLDRDEFGAGSMRPKAESCLQFVESGGERAVITSPDNLGAALDGGGGTQVQRERSLS